MPSWEMKIITAEARRLLAMAAEDGELRADLRALALEILAATEGPQSHAPATTLAPSEIAPAQTPSVAEQVRLVEGDDRDGPMIQEIVEPVRPQSNEPLRELTLGRSSPSPAAIHDPAGVTSGPVDTDAGLGELEARCRLKAEAARRAAARQRNIRGGADSQDETIPEAPEIAEWAGKLTDCFYWLNASDTPAPDIALLDDLAGCYEAVAEALSLVAKGGRRGAGERSLGLVAEAQSALRRALQRLQAPDDPDQLAAYEWVRGAAAWHRVYLKRYLRADDLADPARWPELLARIVARAGGDRQTRQQRPRIERVRHHLGIIGEGLGTDEDWQAVIEAVDELIGEGVPPSDREIRDLLLPVIDDLPHRDDLPQGFRLVFREIDHFLTTKRDSSDKELIPEPTAEVKEARRLLGGRGVVLIGGACRPEAQEALRTALGLDELAWIETKEHQSVGSFEPAVARPDVALVLLAIRWSSHSFGDVKRFCDRYGKPLVRLPGGYSPNQVAAQILAQCSGQLGAG